MNEPKTEAGAGGQGRREGVPPTTPRTKSVHTRKARRPAVRKDLQNTRRTAEAKEMSRALKRARAIKGENARRRNDENAIRLDEIAAIIQARKSDSDRRSDSELFRAIEEILQ